MKIAVLTSNKDRHLYFARRIVKEYPDSIVVCQSKNIQSIPYIEKIAKRIKNADRDILRFAKKAFNYRKIKYFSAMLRKEKEEAEKLFFEEEAKNYLKGHKERTFFIDTEINHPWVEGLLKRFKPDIACVMGTALVKRNIYIIPRYCINMHTGISPQYRGSASNMWPFIFDEPQYIGVTIHMITARIDGGEIIYHGRPNIKREDNFSTLNCKSIIKGAGLMVRAIEDCRRSKLKSVPQWSGGRLLLSKDLDGNTVLRYYEKLDSGLLGRYMDNPEAFPVSKEYNFTIE